MLNYKNHNTMKKTTLFFNLFFCLILFLYGCQRQNELTEMPKSNLRSIVSFVLNPAQNFGKITTTITGTIVDSTKIITLNMPSNAKLTALRPQLVISPWATVYPNNLDSVDFSKDTTVFTVTSESGKKSVYAVVKVFTYKYSGASVYSVSFTGFAQRYALSTISQTTNCSLGPLPAGVSISSLPVTLEFAPDSQNTTVTVKENNSATGRPFTNSTAVDFTTPVTFVVKAEDGVKTSTYIVSAKP